MTNQEVSRYIGKTVFYKVGEGAYSRIQEGEVIAVRGDIVTMCEEGAGYQSHFESSNITIVQEVAPIKASNENTQSNEQVIEG